MPRPTRSDDRSRLDRLAPLTPRELAESLAPRVRFEDAPAISPWRRHALSRVDAGLALLLGLIVLAARGPLIDRGATLLHSDEAIVGIMAQDIAAGRCLPIYFYGQRYMGALEAYVVAGLSAVVNDPIVALRLAPALFFSLLVAVQVAMLTRWFGRAGGLVGAGALLAAPPMLAQWSISARGGYVEVWLWGSLLLWAWGEWFTDATRPASRGRRAVFGGLIGSGAWINPSMVAFVLPIVALAAVESLGRNVKAVRRRLGLLTLPLLAVAAVLVATTLYSVEVADGSVRRHILLGLLPARFGAVVVVLLLGVLGWWLWRRPAIRSGARAMLERNAALLMGLLVGSLPAIVYLLGGILGRHEIEPALPLAVRPPWTAAAPFEFLLRGLPLLMGADPAPFLALVTAGREPALHPLGGGLTAMITWANAMVTASLLILVIAFIVWRRDELARLLRLERGAATPTALLVLGVCGLTALYLLSAAAHDFNTIRYLLPACVFVPGLLAAVVGDRGARGRGTHAVRVVYALLLASWLTGQVGLWRQIGCPHPLQPLAAGVASSSVRDAQAELFDAHLLSYLTNQRCRVQEYEPFWARLGHYRREHGAAATYIVDRRPIDWVARWDALGLPGRPPPETQRTLARRLDAFLEQRPSAVLDRRMLPGDYELIRLSTPLPAVGF